MNKNKHKSVEELKKAYKQSKEERNNESINKKDRNKRGRKCN